MRLHYTIVGDGRNRCCEAETVRIGRDPEAEVCFDEEFISRNHARVCQSSGRVYVEDAGSDNGTFVNGRRIAVAVELREGDLVRFGEPGPEIRIEKLVITSGRGAVAPAVIVPQVPARDGALLAPRPRAGNARPEATGATGKPGRKTHLGAAVLGVGALLLAVMAFNWYQEPPSLTSLFEKVDPATVKVHTTEPNGEHGSGSGFLIDRRGWVVTNFHVVAGSTSVEIELHDGRRIPVQDVIAACPQNDVAILHITAPSGGLRVLQVLREDDRPPPVGTEVCVVGYPLGLKKSLTTGTVTARMSGYQFKRWLEERKVDPRVVQQYDDNTIWLQTDAAVSKGNSGGPLLDRYGRVIGLTTWGITGAGTEGMNFACAAKHIKHLIKGWDGEYRPLSNLKSNKTP